ncbi:MAG: hypothetical protein IT165_28035 [Bryobacterales bacterium]|nr:hypothetical protein [Bryobacterales bacterium]
MFPEDYTQWYLNLPVNLGPDGKPVVEVKEYQNPGPNWVVKWDAAEPVLDDDGLPKFKDGKPLVKVNEKGIHADEWNRVAKLFLAQKSKGPLFGDPFPPPGFEDRMIQMVYKGGGTPSQITVILQLVWADWKTKGFPYPTMKTPKEKLQRYVKDWIGLYCTGLVGGYVYDFMGKSYDKRGPNTAIPLFAEKSYCRSSISEITPRDVLVWKNGGHIAIIHRIAGKDPFRMAVCESSVDGGYTGVTSSAGNIYTVTAVKDTVFKVIRGLPSSGMDHDVYIADPWIVSKPNLSETITGATTAILGALKPK